MREEDEFVKNSIEEPERYPSEHCERDGQTVVDFIHCCSLTLGDSQRLIIHINCWPYPLHRPLRSADG